MTSLQYRTSLFTSVLVILLLWMPGAGATAQFDRKPISAATTVPAAQQAGTVSNRPVAGQDNSPSPEGDLKLVVALFRHGVRAPLAGFGEKAGEHSKNRWPDLVSDWHVCPTCWGYLTPQGSNAVKVLGAYYGSYYSKNAWPNGFRVYLWADMDERTIATAEALRAGMQRPGIDVKVGTYLADLTDQRPDPLFHPFPAMCGTPDTKELQRIATDINDNWRTWLDELKDPFRHLYDVLACNGTKECQQPLKHITDHATAWSAPAQRPSSPIKWEGQFPYASSATEAFLLEYANGMPTKKVGWGEVIDEKTGSIYKLCNLLRLHEFYFTKTERDQYLAGIEGSNLVREILDQLNRKAKYKSPMGKCLRSNEDTQFVGLVGHDTNLANVGTLLHVRWSFDSNQLPPDARGVPENDALPAGALVFELRQRGSEYRVCIEYVTQSPMQMRNAPEPGEPFRLQTTCGDDSGKDLSPCEVSLQAFNDVVKKAIGNNNEFLSGCQGDRQVCPGSPKEGGKDY